MAKKTWLVGIGGSELDGVRLSRVSGTKAQVKKHIAALVRKAKADDKGSWESGTTAAKDIYEQGDHLDGWANFSTYHVDYTAEVEKTPLELGGAV